MADYFEVDFLDVETDSSGDAITVRYEVNGQQYIHVVDGGYEVTGDAIVKHIQTHYDGSTCVDHVVVTHCDRDHTGGLRTVLEELEVGTLWMLRPWRYADQLLPRFATYNSVDRLRARLRSIYSNLVALEDIANERGIPIRDPFMGASIGAFTVLAPSYERYLDLIVDSDKTPESVEESAATVADKAFWTLKEVLKKAANYINALWGEEVFSTSPTSAENEMSVIQYAHLSGKRIVLTGDAGKAALTEAADYAPMAGLHLPGVDRFQVPHHGSRRNVSSEILDRWLGPRLDAPPGNGQESFHALISSAKADTDHPRKAVVRALIHRGAKVVATESKTVRIAGGDAPERTGWVTALAQAYPDSQEA